MKARYIIYGLLIMFSISCHSNDKQQTQVKSSSDSTITAKTDSNIINYPCAIIVEPDDNAIARLKKTATDDAYRTIVDDNVYYMDESSKFLDSAKVKKVQRLSKGVITFKANNGDTFEMKLDTLSWAVILFNAKTKPIEADMTAIQDSYKAYMK